MEYIYDGKIYVLDDILYEEKIDDIVVQYVQHILDQNINRYEVVVDDQELQKLIIQTILQRVSSSMILDLKDFNNKGEYLYKKEQLLKDDKVLVTVNQNSLIEKMPGETREQQEKNFYHNIINFMCDSYSHTSINYQEIMFFTNDEFRRYIKYAYDISSRSQSIFFNTAYRQKNNKTLSLDDTLERKYRGK